MQVCRLERNSTSPLKGFISLGLIVHVVITLVKIKKCGALVSNLAKEAATVNEANPRGAVALWGQHWSEAAVRPESRSFGRLKA